MLSRRLPPFGFRPGGARRRKCVVAVRRKAGHGRVAIGHLRHTASLVGPNDRNDQVAGSEPAIPKTLATGHSAPSPCSVSLGRRNYGSRENDICRVLFH